MAEIAPGGLAGAIGEKGDAIAWALALPHRQAPHGQVQVLEL